MEFVWDSPYQALPYAQAQFQDLQKTEIPRVQQDMGQYYDGQQFSHARVPKIRRRKIMAKQSRANSIKL